MTDDERRLLLWVASWIEEEESEIGRRLGKTSLWAKDIQRLIDAIRPRDQSGIVLRRFTNAAPDAPTPRTDYYDRPDPDRSLSSNSLVLMKQTQNYQPPFRHILDILKDFYQHLLASR